MANTKKAEFLGHRRSPWSYQDSLESLDFSCLSRWGMEPLCFRPYLSLWRKLGVLAESGPAILATCSWDRCNSPCSKYSVRKPRCWVSKGKTGFDLCLEYSRRNVLQHSASLSSAFKKIKTEVMSGQLSQSHHLEIKQVMTNYLFPSVSKPNEKVLRLPRRVLGLHCM